MTEQTFSVSKAPRVLLTQVQGDLSVSVWEQQAISVEIDGSVAGLQQEGDTLLIDNCMSDLVLRVPEDTSIKASNVNGDVDIEGVRRIELENASGDVSLKDISGHAGLENIGEGIDLTNLGGDLTVTNAPVLHVRQKVGGDAELIQVGQIEIASVGADLSVKDAETVVISTIGGNLNAEDIGTALHCGTVGGDCQVQGSAGTLSGGQVMAFTIGNIGADLEIWSAASIRAGNVGGDCELRDVQGDVAVGHVGGGANFMGIGGNLLLGHTGADAALKGIQGSIEVSSVGGDLDLQAAFPMGSRTLVKVGGDANLVLPEQPNLSIRATVGGDVLGPSIISSGRGNMISLVYGDGAAHLELKVGGDLNLHSADSPRSSSTMGGSWKEFGYEMSNLGRDMGKLGQELSREIAAAFTEASWSHGAGIAHDIARKAEEHARHAQRKAEEHARHAQRKAEEHARQAQRKAEEHTRRAGRVNVRINKREWRMDPEWLERIKDEAQRAASEGVSGALEAVERAVSNLHIPTPPMRPAPPMPPSPFGSVPPMPPSPRRSEQVEHEGNDNAAEVPSSADLEQERMAILRMIAEGRITPEEGDLLLEALGS